MLENRSILEIETPHPIAQSLFHLILKHLGYIRQYKYFSKNEKCCFRMEDAPDSINIKTLLEDILEKMTIVDHLILDEDCLNIKEYLNTNNEIQLQYSFLESNLVSTVLKEIVYYITSELQVNMSKTSNLYVNESLLKEIHLLDPHEKLITIDKIKKEMIEFYKHALHLNSSTESLLKQVLYVFRNSYSLMSEEKFIMLLRTTDNMNFIAFTKNIGEKNDYKQK